MFNSTVSAFQFDDAELNAAFAEADAILGRLDTGCAALGARLSGLKASTRDFDYSVQELPEINALGNPVVRDDAAAENDD